jgi:sugar phosphate isomerase/epimerase
MSKYFRIELDIGHFVAANYDPVAYIAKEHARIRVLHFKDRKKNQGENYPWGQGDTPIKEVLQLLKKNKWPIPCDIEYEYKGTEDATIEVKKCLDYMKRALA